MAANPLELDSILGFCWGRCSQRFAGRSGCVGSDWSKALMTQHDVIGGFRAGRREAIIIGNNVCSWQPPRTRRDTIPGVSWPVTVLLQDKVLRTLFHLHTMALHPINLQYNTYNTNIIHNKLSQVVSDP